MIQETSERLDESIEKHIVNEHANITNGINNVNDICIDVNRSSISSPSRLNKRSFCDLKVNENENTNELFFNEIENKIKAFSLMFVICSLNYKEIPEFNE